MTSTTRLPIGQRLVQAGRIDPWQLQSALAHQRRWGGRLGAALVGLGFVGEEDMLTEVARQLGVPYLAIGDRYVPESIVRLVPEKVIRSRRVFPIALGSQTRRGPLVVATEEPQNLAMLDEVAFASGYAVRPVLTSSRDLDLAIQHHLTAIDISSGTGAVELPSAPAGEMRVVPFAHNLH
jgi:Type II secretion system (T2SS), protein E, N-terminal domain